MRYVRSIRKGYMANHPMHKPQGGLVKPSPQPYFPPKDVIVNCVVCGNEYPRDTMSEKHDFKVCKFCKPHVHPDNVYRYQRGGKHNRYN